MKKILSLLALSCCFVAGHSYAEMVETPTSDGSDDSVGMEFELRGSYVGETDFERGDREIDNLDTWNGSLRFLVLPRTPIGILRLGFEYENYDFGIPAGLQIPDRLQSLTAVVGLDTKLSDSILIRFEAKPGLYSGNDVESGDFNVPFILGGTYLYSSTLQFVFGVGVDVESEYRALPGGGVRWKFAPQWVLNATLPAPRLEYSINRNLMIYAGAELRGGNYRVDDDFVGDPSEPANLNNTIVQYSEIRTGAGLSWKIGENSTLVIDGGYVPRREFDYHRADIRYKSEGGAPYGAISFKASF
jgi:hypothetical protein